MKAHLFEIDTAILTNRTVVRRLRENDGKILFELVKRNKNYIEDALPTLVQHIKDATYGEIFVRKKIAAWLLQEEYVFGIWDKESAQLIGLLEIQSIDWNVLKANLSYFIDKAHEQKGIMTEAMWALLAFCFEQLKLEKLQIQTAMDNYPGQRLARKCKFRREGDLRAAFKKLNGEIIDIMLLGLTRADYYNI